VEEKDEAAAMTGDGHRRGPRMAPRHSQGVPSRPGSASGGGPACWPVQHAAMRGGRRKRRRAAAAVAVPAWREEARE